MPILITRPAPPQIGTVHLVPDVSQLGEMIGDFKQAIKAARFADDRIAVGARRSSDASCSKGAAEFGFNGMV